jgi:hypothetical protein
MTGRVAATVMMTKTNLGSVKIDTLHVLDGRSCTNKNRHACNQDAGPESKNDLDLPNKVKRVLRTDPEGNFRAKC